MVVVGLALTSAAAYLAGTARGDGDGGIGETTAAASSPTTSIGTAATGDAGVLGDDVLTAAREDAVVIPPGHHGVAITLPFTAAGGGYVGAGDKVDVFAVEPGSAAHVVLSAATVLDVSVEVAPRVATGTGERASASQITYLLAVPTQDAPEVITAVQTKTVYVALLPEKSVAEDAAARSVEPSDTEGGVR